MLSKLGHNLHSIRQFHQSDTWQCDPFFLIHKSHKVTETPPDHPITLLVYPLDIQYTQVPHYHLLYYSTIFPFFIGYCSIPIHPCPYSSFYPYITQPVSLYMLYPPALPISQHPYPIPYPLFYLQDHPCTPYPITLGHRATQKHPPTASVTSPVLQVIRYCSLNLFVSEFALRKTSMIFTIELTLDQNRSHSLLVR